MLIGLLAGMIFGGIAGASSWLLAAAHSEHTRAVYLGRAQMAHGDAWTMMEVDIAGYRQELSEQGDQMETDRNCTSRLDGFGQSRSRGAGNRVFRLRSTRSKKSGDIMDTKAQPTTNEKRI
jgi:gas vesicle protein